LTAEQWKMWTLIYSPFVLQKILPPNHFEVWMMFVNVCALICRHVVSTEQVKKAHKLLIKFCTRFQDLYGDFACTPNMHMHCHLDQCILDVGPTYSFWCFSFERYNSILEKMQKSWKSPEAQF